MLLAAFTLTLLIVVLSFVYLANFSGIATIDLATIIALFVCLMPTTIGALLPAIGISVAGNALHTTGQGGVLHLPLWAAAIASAVPPVSWAAALHLVTREDVLQAKPDLAKRMANVQKKGLEFIRANGAAAIADVILANKKAAEQFQGLDRAVVVKAIEHVKPGFGTGCVSKAGFDVEMKIALDYKLVSGPITFDQFADTGLAGSCP